MDIMLWILSGLLIPVGIAMIPFIRIVYFRRPELTIESVMEKFESQPQGLSTKNDISKGYIDGEKAIQIFLVSWTIRLIITNNSPITAFNPKLHIKKNQIGFTLLNELSEYQPLKEGDRRELKGKMSFFEECTGMDRTHSDKLPPIFNDFFILLEYKNQYKRTFYTVYTYKDNKDINVFRKMRPNNSE